VFECDRDRDASIMRPWPTRSCPRREENLKMYRTEISIIIIIIIIIIIRPFSIVVGFHHISNQYEVYFTRLLLITDAYLEQYSNLRTKSAGYKRFRKSQVGVTII
jgi:hypothetical protein